MEDVQQLLNKYKLRVKHWEHDFKKKHSRKPSKVSSEFKIERVKQVADPIIIPRSSTTFARHGRRSNMPTRSTIS